ncbi:MAG: CopG family ribbon-helix-helix protein [Alphaproteobacteria bacterium]|jgi:predicted transcriptional regulator|nr:CopG family ribbon-helix-helix protein [Alphaproteobacteria bacterium]
MTKSSTITVRLDDDLKHRLEALADSTKRSRSFVAAEAIAAYVDLNAWQVAAIEAGLASADRGDLIPQAEITKWVDSWGSDEELPPPKVR